MLEKLKERWNVKNGWDVAVILIVFACTGFSVMFLKRALMEVWGLNDDTSPWIRWAINLLVILPLYQVILLAWGWIWGKYDFFLAFEKRMFSRMAGWFKRK
ncbi:hypothetical protein CLV98_1219 [Dyadobacter jejuensis]|uniref:DUF6787 domain-containing protein n=1 Tax=Dyadobacter jejuensis TaxID=1082580 RepID=A0A316AUF8_9BACT|nr:DUF6787 family protein [Dyadobacter jejuensis]PWJ53737.1 hypothetical protein CLV98_1219 [Dyadobacter jejuensis]